MTDRTLTQADVTAIREAIFEQAPITFMDTQKIILENRALKAERIRLLGYVALLCDGIKEDTGQFKMPDFSASDLIAK